MSENNPVADHIREMLNPSLSTLAKREGKKLADIRLAHEATGVEDARDLLARNRERTYPEFSVDGAGGGNVEYAEHEQEEMKLGDTIINNIGDQAIAAASKNASEGTSPHPVTPVSSGASQQPESTARKVAKALGPPLVGAALAVGAMKLMENRKPDVDYINDPDVTLIDPAEFKERFSE